jgi:hypothetical protein
MDNDANVGALGEGVHGAGRGYRPLFYMTLSTGIGGGILTADGVYRGADSYAGELGHLTIRPGGPDCLCGSTGCFERMCCGLWLERDYGKTAKELVDDPAFVEQYVVNLALGLKACVMLLNPARIVIGGGIPKAGERLFGPLRAELGRQITAWSRARVDVVPADGLSNAADVFAMLQAREAFGVHQVELASDPESYSAPVRGRLEWGGALGEAELRQAAAERARMVSQLDGLLEGGRVLMLPVPASTASTAALSFRAAPIWIWPTIPLWWIWIS